MFSRLKNLSLTGMIKIISIRIMANKLDAIRLSKVGLEGVERVQNGFEQSYYSSTLQMGALMVYSGFVYHMVHMLKLGWH